MARPRKDFASEYGHAPLRNDAGFTNRGGRMLNEETYENFWDLMGSVPSLDHPGKSVTEEGILEFDHMPINQGYWTPY